MIEQTHIVLAMILGFSAMLLMAGFIVAFILLYQRRQIKQEKYLAEVQRDYQRSLLETALDSEEAERRRMAGELHDDIGVMLSLTKMSLNQLIQRAEGRQEEQVLAGKVRGLLDETISHVRRISQALVPSTLEQFGLEAALEDLVSKAAPSGRPLVILQKSKSPVPRLSSKVELALFRIAQELLNNSIKHAAASSVWIQTEASAEALTVQIIDDGCGFDVESVRSDKTSGLGLKNIESRLNVIRGDVTYTRLSPGMRVTIGVPLDRSL
jgi:two-component system NarL family sensor kinase